MDPRLKAEDDGVWGGAHAKLHLSAPASCWNCFSISPLASRVLPISVMLGLDPSIEAEALCFANVLQSDALAFPWILCIKKSEAGLSPGLFLYPVNDASVGGAEINREEQRLA